MPVHKRKRNGKTTWYYKFDLAGSTREDRTIIRGFGYGTKQEAIDAEAARRIEEQARAELAKAGSGVAAAPPKTLATLLDEFLRQHVQKKLAPKTQERYREMAAYVDPALLAMPLADITPLHLSREWNRLLESGGHHRRTKKARPLSAKTVRNIAGVVSSAFRRAEIWGLVTTNPVTRSEPPVPKRRVMKILTVAQEETLFASATSIWCLSTFLRVVGATASRRGEILALRWSDLSDDSHVMISRSLTQTNDDPGFQDHEDRQSPPNQAARLGAGGARGPPQAAGRIPPAIRSRLPGRPRSGFRKSGWLGAEAGLSVGIGVAAVPEAEAAEGHQPPLVAPHPRLRTSGYRRAAAGRVGPRWATPRCA